MSLQQLLDANWTLGPSSGQALLVQSSDDINMLKARKDFNLLVYTTNRRHRYEMTRSLPSVLTSSTDQGIRLNGRKAIVFLRRHSEGHLGVGIQGGQEFNSPVVVSVPGEQGQSRGLRIGDKILNVNGYDFRNITHAEAVMVIQSAWNVLMLVEHQDNSGHKQARSELSLRQPVGRHQELDLFIHPSKNGKLGCGVNRDTKGNLKIGTLDQDSPASRAGLHIDDCLVQIEGIPVSTLSDQQVFALIQNVKRICIKVNRQSSHHFDQLENKVGKLSISNESPQSLPQFWSSTPRNYTSNCETKEQGMKTHGHSRTCSKSLFNNLS
ncbi:harmonin [Biomphalaria pfeifferi]|uniref:Harmonin n=1 Tax=Biomphalaria pfeifferi TaxID=112525 RepID=A0AAD8FG03_BIOPF|nr:harmonin [Biomphalaria pfeifferi]